MTTVSLKIGNEFYIRMNMEFSYSGQVWNNKKGTQKKYFDFSKDKFYEVIQLFRGIMLTKYLIMNVTV